MKQKIEGFHLEGEGHWVADLSCGHKQHMHHQPPWMNRPWVLTPEGRQTRLGAELDCKRCDEVQAAVAEATRAACLEAMTRAYEEGGLSGLCAEGRGLKSCTPRQKEGPGIQRETSKIPGPSSFQPSGFAASWVAGDRCIYGATSATVRSVAIQPGKLALTF
jgi:hypothetical protein